MKRFLIPLLAAATVSGGCADIPICEKVSISVYETQEGRLFVMDEPNFMANIERQRAIQEGRCRLPLRVRGVET